MRFGVVGAGAIGQLRIKALSNAEGCELTAIADLDIARARAAAPSRDTGVFDDYQQMLESDAIDAVVVSTPPQFHEEMVTHALEAGKHVLCEKPLSNSVNGCRRMIEVSSRTGKVLATGFNMRFYPAFQFMKQTIDSGVIGELDNVRGFAGHVGLSEFKSSWEYDRSIVGGGALMDIGIHMIDLTQYLLGDVVEVFGIATSNIWKLNGSEDNGYAIMRSPEGKIATLHASWSEWKGYRFHIEAYGDKGMVRGSYGPMRNMLVYKKSPGGGFRRKLNFYPKNIILEKLLGWQWTAEKSFRRELEDFVRLTEGRSEVIADGFAGLRVVEIASAIYRSTEEKQSINLAARK